jgi:hypothetical protein
MADEVLQKAKWHCVGAVDFRHAGDSFGYVNDEHQEVIVCRLRCRTTRIALASCRGQASTSTN